MVEVPVVLGGEREMAMLFFLECVVYLYLYFRAVLLFVVCMFFFFFKSVERLCHDYRGNMESERHTCLSLSY